MTQARKEYASMKIYLVFFVIACIYWSPFLVHSALLLSVNDSILLNAIQFVDRRFLYHSNKLNERSTCIAHSLGTRQFQFKGGCISDLPDKFHLLKQYAAVRIVHYCPLISNLMDSHLRIQRPISQDCKHDSFAKFSSRSRDNIIKKLWFEIPVRRVFRATTFLEKLRDKKLTFYGDSINRQIFLDLVAELNPYQTEFSYMAPNNTIVIRENSTTTYHLPDLHRVFSKRIYGAYNVSIVYYDDGYANRFRLNRILRTEHVWDKELLSSDFILVGIGAWFKPGFHPVLNNANYYEDMRLKLLYLNSTMWRLREVFQQHIPHAKIIWRTNAHVGMIDEFPGINQRHNLSYDTSPRGNYFHTRGEVWENISFGAVWPIYFNQLYAPIAQHFGDKVLDYWQVSVRYLTWVDALVQEADHLLAIRASKKSVTHAGDDASARKRFHPLLNDANLRALSKFIRKHSRAGYTISTHAFYPVMSDSLHYCPGGVPRAGAFLLHDLLSELLRVKTRLVDNKDRTQRTPGKENVANVSLASLQIAKQVSSSSISNKISNQPLIVSL